MLVSVVTFPASIETYLKESSFSQTEILILHRLLAGEPMTLRELALRTGRSVSTLDSGMKKLMRRGIILKESVNGSPKYALDTFERVLVWVKDDMRHRQEQLKRKERDFEAFVGSLQNAALRPGIEHFEGPDGFRRAYERLLEVSGKDMLQYLPVACREEDDPLSAFKAGWMRERRRRNVQLRTIAPDTPLGRRYQSRDAFEYRRTVLVPEKEFPHTIEHIVTGDILACFNHREQRAYFIRAPELVASARHFFEFLWLQASMLSGQETSIKPPRVGFLERVRGWWKR